MWWKVCHITCSPLCEWGYTQMRDKVIRDTFAKIMHEVCNDVEFEPTLLLLQGKTFILKSTSTDEKA